MKACSLTVFFLLVALGAACLADDLDRSKKLNFTAYIDTYSNLCWSYTNTSVTPAVVTYCTNRAFEKIEVCMVASNGYDVRYSSEYLDRCTTDSISGSLTGFYTNLVYALKARTFARWATGGNPFIGINCPWSDVRYLKPTATDWLILSTNGTWKSLGKLGTKEFLYDWKFQGFRRPGMPMLRKID